jgi:voltage-gated potassium channel
MISKAKLRIFQILDVANKGDRASHTFDVFIISLIVLNILAVILHSYKTLAGQYSHYFDLFELFSVIIFSIEYVLRLWSCTAKEGFSGSFKGRFRYTLRPLILIDLLAILPFYIPFLIPIDLRFLRAFRLFRLIRILKLARYADSLNAFSYVFRKKKEQIGIALLAIFILLIIASSMMYYFENEAQPEAFSSIPAAMWWGVATLTTVGYGDIYPVTALGKILGAIIAMLGIGLFALPAGILGSGFFEYIQERGHNPKKCPHCGKIID